jgi:hypothetical protein
MGRFSELNLIIKEGSLDDPLYRKYKELFSSDQSHKSAGQEPQVELKSGVSVDLQERYLALSAIMSCFSEINKINGMHSENGYKKAGQRYGSDIDHVMKKMDKKREVVNKEINDNVNVLIAKEAMKKAGYSDELINSSHYDMKDNLSNQYGPGNAYSLKRNDFLKHILKK